MNQLVRRKPAVPEDEFTDYWLREHARQRLDIAADLDCRRLSKDQTQHDDEVNQTLQSVYGTAADAYDFVDQMTIYDLAVFKRGLADADVRAVLKRTHEDERHWIDHARSDYWFSVELPQVFSGEPGMASWTNTLLKVYYVPRHLPTLTLEQAQLHWLSCHGAMAREYVAFLPYTRYAQGHRKRSAVCDELKALLGGGFEDIDLMIGQAEAWIDRRVLPTMQGPETERMMAMLVQDIALFVDAGTSHIFATKEHRLLDRPLVGEPIPALFDAD